MTVHTQTTEKQYSTVRFPNNIKPNNQIHGTSSSFRNLVFLAGKEISLFSTGQVFMTPFKRACHWAIT
jgi:hypothetical protein